MPLALLEASAIPHHLRIFFLRSLFYLPKIFDIQIRHDSGVCCEGVAATFAWVSAAHIAYVQGDLESLFFGEIE